MNRQEAETYANHWQSMASNAKRQMDSRDVGSEPWWEARAWYMECYARADVWATVKNRLEDRELAA